MSCSLTFDDFDRLLAGDVVEAWGRCLPIWRERGRIEDYPRNVRFYRYRPSAEKRLGRAFAAEFLDDYSFVIGKLSSDNPLEVMCAHDLLKEMMLRWEIVPVEVWDIDVPLPDSVRDELTSASYASFRGNTFGELFRFERQEDL